MRRESNGGNAENNSKSHKYYLTEEEKLQAERKRQKIQAKKEKEKRQERIMIVVFILLLIGIAGMLFLLLHKNGESSEKSSVGNGQSEQVTAADSSVSGDSSASAVQGSEAEPNVTVTPTPTEELPKEVLTSATPDDLYSDYACMIRISDQKVLLDKNAYSQFYPASVTKIMTVLLAIENLPDLDQMVTIIDSDVQDAINGGASRAGFISGETVPVRDLLYGAMLPSGADACYALARTIAGDVPSFVDMMNAKAAEIGMTSTHFMNPTGLHEADHYSTCYDMAILLETALQNDLFREVDTTQVYTTTSTEQNPGGIQLSTTMAYVLSGEYQLANGAVIEGGKTGMTDEAGRCLATFGTFGGEEYICVSFGAPAYSGTDEAYNGTDAKTMFGGLYYAS